jgi:hypothetical protein
MIILLRKGLLHRAEGEKFGGISPFAVYFITFILSWFSVGVIKCPSNLTYRSSFKQKSLSMVDNPTRVRTLVRFPFFRE